MDDVRDFGYRSSVDGVMVPSSAMAKRLRDYGVTTRLQVLPTGIPLVQFSQEDGHSFKASLCISSRRPTALFVGRVAHEKNIGFLLDAMIYALKNCPDMLLLITGEGPAEAELQRQAARLGISASVRFLGYLDRAQELPACYAAADVFVFASRTETQGLLLLEALAAGVPVIALSAMGTTDILTNAPGCIAAPDDPQVFGHTVGRFLADTGVRHPQREQARQTASR